jgi:hypothetical protein
MGNYDDDEDSDDSNAVRANGLHDLHCDLIRAPFPVQVNNEGKGGGKKRGGEKKKEREPKSPHTQAPPNLRFLKRTMHKTQRATEPQKNAFTLSSFLCFALLCFALLCFAFLSFPSSALHVPSPRQASKQTS